MTQKQKILLAFLLPGIFALAAVAFFLERSHRQLTIDRWSVEHQALVTAIAKAMTVRIEEARDLLIYTAALPEFSRLDAGSQTSPDFNGIPPGIEQEKRRILDALLSTSKALSVAFILKPDGDHYLSHPYTVQRNLKKFNLADRAYFQEANRTRQPSISDSLVGADGRLAVVVDIPLINRAGELYGHLGGVVTLDNLSQLVAPSLIAPFDIGLLTDRNDKLIAHTDPQQIGPEGQFFRYPHPLLNSERGAINAPHFAHWADEHGEEWLGFILRLESGWNLLLQRRLASIQFEYREAVWESVLLVALILLASGSVGLSSAFVVARRWERADAALNDVHAELEHRVAERTAELASSQVQLARSRDFYLSVLEKFPAPVWRTGLEGHRDYFNQTWLDFTGKTVAEEIDQGWQAGIHPDDRERWRTRYTQAISRREPFAIEYRLLRHDGAYRYLVDIGRPCQDIDGAYIGYLGACFDVTERHQATEQLQLVASVFSHAREGIIITDPGVRIINVNDAFCSITGYQRDEAIGRNPSFLRSEHQNQAFYANMWNGLKKEGYWQGEIWNRKKEGELYAELLTISAIRDPAGAVSHYVGIFADITLQKEHERRLEKLAHFDPLTELPNRTLLGDRLHMSLALAQRNGGALAVCLLDLDGFKQVNDTLGHAAGDQLLIDFAQRIRLQLRQTDTLARLGGDEFVILLNDLQTPQEYSEALSRIIEAARQPYPIGDSLAQVSASIGITLFPEDDAAPDLLLRHADQAMYAAKQAGGNRYMLFDPFKDLAQRAERTALGRLMQALEAGEFELHYQPKVDMRAGKVIGAEALIRWRHPERGIILPGEFLPLTEDTSFSITLGEWVIRESLSHVDTWHRQGLPLKISVNIAPSHLQIPDFAQELAGLLSAFPDLPCDLLELEILENAALHDTSHAASVIESCRRMGVSFALDDFGTGYSSLLYLKHLPAETLKIDQSFVRNMLEDAEHLAIIKGVIGLAEAFNRTVIAEGVESEAHGAALLALGCHQAQGYAIARPMPASELPNWIKHWQAPDSWKSSSLPD